MKILAAIKREERKLEKQLHKIQHQLSGVRAVCKSFGRLNGPRTKANEEACLVCRWESEDCEGGEEALGEGSGASEESGGII